MFNITVYLNNKEELAEFVNDLLSSSKLSFASTMITDLGKSEGYSVTIATDGSSVDTVKKWVRNSYGLLMSTLHHPIQDG